MIATENFCRGRGERWVSATRRWTVWSRNTEAAWVRWEAWTFWVSERQKKNHTSLTHVEEFERKKKSCDAKGLLWKRRKGFQKREIQLLVCAGQGSRTGWLCEWIGVCWVLLMGVSRLSVCQKPSMSCVQTCVQDKRERKKKQRNKWSVFKCVWTVQTTTAAVCDGVAATGISSSSSWLARAHDVNCKTTTSHNATAQTKLTIFYL